MRKISFVIPFIHEYPSIYATINHIQTEMFDSSYEWEIIAAENGTVDSNTAHAFNGKRPLYRALIHKKRLKYVFDSRQCGPVSRNTGAKVADGDYVIFMDAHTSLGKNTIDILADYLADHDECGGIAGLTSWSHYDFKRMGAYYQLFGGGGGPTLPTHMHGHYMAMGHLKDRTLIINPRPFTVVMGSQAYTMYRLKEFLELGGYFNSCRFYPHPEGYMPLKVWMTGKTMVTHPLSWHIHGMYPRQYAVSAEEREGKIREYGGYSWHEHGMRNVLMIAYILGDEKWLNICYDALVKKHNPRRLPELKTSAIEVVDSEPTKIRSWLRNHQECSLDEVLINARKNRIAGLENWYDKIGRDPLR